MKKMFKQFSFPCGVPSHCAPETPGSINEGGELGYSIAHAFGAVFDNPDLIATVVVGDGEAETGPLATSWQSNKFLNPVTDGAVLPILHLNGYKRTFNYIYTILQNYMRDQYRRRSRWREESLEMRELAGASPGRGQEVDEIVLQKLRVEEVAAYVAQMDEKYRLPFVLKYYNHFTEDEIAATLDLPKGAVAVRIFRAKKKIQDYIRQKEGE